MLKNKIIEINTIKIEDIEFCKVNAGPFIRGSTSTPEEEPEKTIDLSTFLISKFPITNSQYLRFVTDTGYKRPPLINDKVFGLPNNPVVTVSWYDAMEYCLWLSKILKEIISLPTEAQWEKACRGIDTRTYPWGNSPPNSRILNVNNYIGHTTQVGKYNNESAFGCFDMLGNIWEWCFDWYDENFYKKCSNQDPVNDKGEKLKVIRGGSWRSSVFRATCTHRCFYNPSVRSDRHGFRIAITTP